MNDLIPLADPNPAALFAPLGLTEVLERIAAESRAIVPDLRTKKGRDAIASTAARVARAKTYLDGIGKDYVAQLKLLPAQVDAERKRARDYLDALKEEVRRPLSEFEEAERVRVAALEARLASLNAAADLAPGADSALLAARLAEVEAVTLGEDWGAFALTAARSKDAALAALRGAYTAALEAERRAAERVRMEREHEAQEQAEREARIAQEAARQATEEAEARGRAQQEAAEQRAREVEQQRQDAERRALEAEARRLQQEQDALQETARALQRERERERIEADRLAREQEALRRARDREHAAQVHNAVAADLCALGLSLDEARTVVRGIATGRVGRVAITY